MTSRPRVLVLGQEHVLHWAPLYCAAFRECCDTITCGPPLDVDDFAQHGWEHAAQYLEPHNITTEAETLEEVLALLPPGWSPQLIVTVQTAAAPLRGIARAGCPTVYISVDSWHDPREFQYARQFDFVFVAQKALVPYFVEAGIRRAHWLPLACSPRHHYPVDMQPQHDITFAGTTSFVVNRQRMARLLRLADHFDVSFGGGLGGNEYSEGLSLGRIIFNSSIAQDVNMRIFEAMAIGRPLLTNRDAKQNGLADLFTEGEHFFGYDDDDLIEQARNLLGDESLRSRVAANAREEVMAKHTYRHRVETLLHVVQQAADIDNPCTIRDGEKLSAWIPTGARRIADVGLGLDKSRVALRHMGVEQVYGVALAGQLGRTGSYDAVLPWPIDGVDVDTILCAHPLDANLPLPDLLGRARQVLPPGGELLIILSDGEAAQCSLGGDVEMWDNWSYAEGFHLILLHSSAGNLVMRFRKYTRPLQDISSEIYERFPGGGGEKLPGEQ